jgi:AbiV family abortive infection protein
MRDEFEEGVRLSYEHAVQLLESAEILETEGKISESRFLALHAREELGRAMLLLDDIESGKPYVSYKRYEAKLTNHKHKLRRIHAAVIKATGYKEGPVTITSGLPKGPKKWVPDGDVMRQFAEYDMEQRDRSLYVEYDVVGGGRQWVTPLKPVGFSKASRADIDYSKFCCSVVKEEAKKIGIAL